MIRFLVNAAVYMAAAAIGFLVADVVLDEMSVGYPGSFLLVAVIFGLIQALVSPLMMQITERNATVLTGGVGVFSALIALIVTSLITSSDQLSIEGLSTWILAALIIWLASMIAAFILKLTVAKKIVQDIRD
ncbi:MAG: phage holin family protein [Candidatus Nanopelagicales bacterium]